ncbi:MAG: hypothetical protein ACM3JB_15000 [Acidobacteriaceae bacterium]
MHTRFDPDRLNPEPDSGALFADAIVAIDAFLRALRQQHSTRQFLSELQALLDLQRALDSAAACLAARQVPPEPLRSNYRARLETLAFELHRIQPLLRQEHTRLRQTLRESSTRQAWAETLSQTQ